MHTKRTGGESVKNDDYYCIFSIILNYVSSIRNSSYALSLPFYPISLKIKIKLANELW